MDRLQQQLDFILEIDKEKKIKRQTLLSDGLTFEDDAQHAWHMCIMTLLLSEYSNEKIDVLKTISMLLIHDLVEIDAGDTYAYDETGLETQSEREKKAADRIFNLLPSDQAQKIMDLWLEFEAYETPESKFAHTMDNFQPCMLNAHTNGKMWKEKKVHLKNILKRNKKTSQGSNVLWNYMYTNYIQPNVKVGNIILDQDKSQ
jgi:putative hydrolases of HD superfamily